MHHKAIYLSIFFSCLSLSYAYNLFDNYTSNPSSVWGFGSFYANDFYYYTSYGNYFANSQIKTWNDNLHQTSVNYNPTDIYQYAGNMTYAPHGVSLYPGSAGQRSFVRFYSPSTQCWKFEYSFWGMDSHPTTSDVVIALEDGTVLYASLINSYSPTQPPTSSLSRQLNAGEFIDFSVGYGADHDNSYDTTGVYINVGNCSQVINSTKDDSIASWFQDKLVAILIGSGSGTITIICIVVYYVKKLCCKKDDVWNIELDDFGHEIFATKLPGNCFAKVESSMAYQIVKIGLHSTLGLIALYSSFEHYNFNGLDSVVRFATSTNGVAMYYRSFNQEITYINIVAAGSKLSTIFILLIIYPLTPKCFRIVFLCFCLNNKGRCTKPAIGWVLNAERSVISLIVNYTASWLLLTLAFIQVIDCPANTSIFSWLQLGLSTIVFLPILKYAVKVKRWIISVIVTIIVIVPIATATWFSLERHCYLLTCSMPNFVGNFSMVTGKILDSDLYYRSDYGCNLEMHSITGCTNPGSNIDMSPLNPSYRNYENYTTTDICLEYQVKVQQDFVQQYSWSVTKSPFYVSQCPPNEDCPGLCNHFFQCTAVPASSVSIAQVKKFATIKN